MKVLLSHLKELWDGEYKVAEIAAKLVSLGIEVEEVLPLFSGRDNLVVAEVLAIKPHEKAEKLKVCQVFDGEVNSQIVCGAKNVRAGLKTILAKPGLVLGDLSIKEAELRGVLSQGMLCGFDEINLAEDVLQTQIIFKGDGLVELADDVEIGSKVLPEDYILDLSITPNRGDCLSIYGLARELSNAGFGKLLYKKSEAPLVKTAWFLFEGVDQFKLKSLWHRRLNWLGQKNVNDLVDLANYSMFSLGQPLHFYDADKIHGQLKLDRTVQDTEFLGLDNKSYVIPAGRLVVVDDLGVVSIPGVLGGERCAVTLTTKRVFLEAIYLEPGEVFGYAIDSEAKYRCFRGLDPEIVHESLVYVKDILIANGARLVREDQEKWFFNNLKVNFRPELIAQRLFFMDLTEARTILENMGCRVKVGSELWEVTAPVWRYDFDNEMICLSEIIRVKGMDQIKPEPLSANFNAVYQLPAEELWAERCATLGYYRTLSFPFCAEKLAQSFVDKPVALANPLNNEKSCLRPNVLVSLLENIKNNHNYKRFSLSFWEIGPEYLPDALDTRALVLVKTGDNAGDWQKPKTAVSFWDLKSDLQKLLPGRFSLKINDLPRFIHPGEGAEIVTDDCTIGYIGRVHPKVLNDFGIEQKVFCIGLDFKKIPLKLTYSDFINNDLPIVSRDLSFFVPENFLYKDFEQEILSCDPIIKKVKLIDIYQREAKISWCVRLDLLTDRTLNETEINQIMTGVAAKISFLGLVLREE